MARRFCELGIQPVGGRKIFDCKQVSIIDLLNREIEVLDYLPDLHTAHGDGRYLVHIRVDGSEAKFFTNSTALKSVLDQVQEQDLPFLTTIRAKQMGKGKIYMFT